MKTINLSLKNNFPKLYQNLSGGEAIYDPLDLDKDVTSILWMENVLPSLEGLASAVRSAYITAAISGGTTQLHYPRVYPAWDAAGNVSLYTYINNKHFIYDITNNTWDDLGTAGTSAAPATVAYVDGRTYVHKTGIGVVAFNTGFAATVSVTISGITASSMLGITSALNYAIAWDSDTIYWSAPAALTQFNPLDGTVATGAGSSQLKALKGKIVTVYPISGGFIVYSTKNMVSARYSGNSINPWIFKEVVNSAGIFRLDSVNADNTSDIHFVFTTEGFKVVNLDKADTIFPELTDFLFGYSFYSSDGDGTYTLNTSTYTDATTATKKAPLASKISYIANRYVCISYGLFSATVFKYILIYDRTLQQWGHVKVDHVDVFNHFDVKNYAAGAAIASLKGELSKGEIAVLRDGGYVDTIKPVTTSDTPADAISTTGELVFGALKLTREQMMQLIRVKLCGVRSGIAVKSLTSDSAGERAAEVTWTVSTTDTTNYFEDVTGMTHKLRITGTFNLSSVQVDMNQVGEGTW